MPEVVRGRVVFEVEVAQRVSLLVMRAAEPLPRRLGTNPPPFTFTAPLLLPSNALETKPRLPLTVQAGLPSRPPQSQLQLQLQSWRPRFTNCFTPTAITIPIQRRMTRPRRNRTRIHTHIRTPTPTINLTLTASPSILPW